LGVIPVRCKLTLVSAATGKATKSKEVNRAVENKGSSLNHIPFEKAFSEGRLLPNLNWA
jgi:hypothetical protein